jgi:hypothetical protein
MPKPVFYRQCRLVKTTPGGAFVQVSWIPEPYAATGRVLKLRTGHGAWDDGWWVLGAGDRRLTASEVPDFHELSKAHLRATGDSETAEK